MIDKKRFLDAWAQICGRFGRPTDANQAAAYYEHLSPVLDTETFVHAARAMWVGAKYFPRPADFLTTAADDDWRHVLEAVASWRPPDTAWVEHWNRRSPRAIAACRRLGDIGTLRALYDRDILRLRTAFIEAYEGEAVGEILAAAPTALLGGQTNRALPAEVR